MIFRPVGDSRGTAITKSRFAKRSGLDDSDQLCVLAPLRENLTFTGWKKWLAQRRKDAKGGGRNVGYEPASSPDYDKLTLMGGGAIKWP
jgi:hypothetical protein